MTDNKFCRHVYETVNAKVCPDCGKDTHETDWEAIHEFHREWIASGKAVSDGVWWSI